MSEIFFYDFDMDQTAQKRWGYIFDQNAKIISKIRPELQKLISQYETITTIIKPVYHLTNEKDIMFYDEICYIAERIGMDPFEVLLLQLIYEASSACTTAIFQVDGKPFFFRTMDWPMLFLKEITIGLNIIRKGKEIGKVITWIGYLGFLTATNTKHQYTIAINYRRTSEISVSSLFQNFYRTITLKWPIGYLLRYIISDGMDKEKATNLLKDAELVPLGFHRDRMLIASSPLVSPCYITFFAEKDPYIITRDCDRTVDVRFDNLYQTNCDWGKTEPNILYSVERYQVLQKINLTTDDLLSSLMRFPIINQETIYYQYQFGGLYRSLKN